MGDIMTRSAIVLAKSEVNYGVDPVPTAANAILTSVPDYGLSGDKRERNVVRSTFSPTGFGVGAKRQTIKFSVELKGANDPISLADPSQLDVLLKACAHESIQELGPDQALHYRGYRPVTPRAEMTSCTIYYYMNLNLHALVGCFGTATLNFQTDGFPSVDFSMTGFYATPVVGVGPVGIVYEDFDPPACLNIGLTLGAFAPIGVSKLTVDLGVKISESKDMQAVSGLSAIRVSGREAKLTLECDVEELTTWNPYPIWEAKTKVAISFSMGTSANRVSFSAPAAQLDEPKEAERDGQAIYQLSYLLTGADNEYLIKTH
jgi:hypothetical protein